MDRNEAAEVYLEARLKYEDCLRRLEAEPDNTDLRLAAELAHRARRRAWERWLNLARPTLRQR